MLPAGGRRPSAEVVEVQQAPGRSVSLHRFASRVRKNDGSWLTSCSTPPLVMAKLSCGANAVASTHVPASLHDRIMAVKRLHAEFASGGRMTLQEFYAFVQTVRRELCPHRLQMNVPGITSRVACQYEALAKLPDEVLSLVQATCRYSA